MPLSTHTKSKMIAYADQYGGLALQIGIPLAVVAGGFLLVSVYGGQIRDAGKLSAGDRKFLAESIALSARVLPWATALIVGGVIVRLHREESPGQFLSFIGAVLFFGSPAIFAATANVRAVTGNVLLTQVVNSFVRVGVFCLVPGLLLLLRDIILRIWNGIAGKRAFEKRWGDEEERIKKYGFAKYYGSCWDMAFCREFVRKVCPAFQAKQACWRVKIGCYCDEKTILKAMMSEGKENEFTRGIMKNLGLDDSKSSQLSSKIKRERCRRCGIYNEHQRQKYRVLSPLVFPLVGVVLYAFHTQIEAWLWVVLEKTDKFMSMLTYQTGASASFASEGPLLTTLSMIWITIVALSYALRMLEYCIFELKI